MGTTECQRTTKFSGCFGHGGSLSFITFTAHAKIHCSLFSWTWHPAKTRDSASRKALFRPPSSKTSALTSASQVPCPHGATLQPAISQLCFLKLAIQNGEKLTLDLCSLSRHVFKCISAVPRQYGSQKSSSGSFGKNSPDANLKQRAMTLSSALFKLSTLLNSNEPCPALWKSSWYIVKSSSACNYSCLRPSLECEPWH